MDSQTHLTAVSRSEIAEDVGMEIAREDERLRTHHPGQQLRRRAIELLLRECTEPRLRRLPRHDFLLRDAPAEASLRTATIFSRCCSWGRSRGAPRQLLQLRSLGRQRVDLPVEGDDFLRQRLHLQSELTDGRVASIGTRTATRNDRSTDSDAASGVSVKIWNTCVTAPGSPAAAPP